VDAEAVTLESHFEVETRRTTGKWAEKRGSLAALECHVTVEICSHIESAAALTRIRVSHRIIRNFVYTDQGSHIPNSSHTDGS